MDNNEMAAWQELKQVLDAVPAEDLATLFHGSASERDDLMDRLGLARESAWLVDILVKTES